MNELLVKRCALATLASMVLALVVGLAAWGPIPLAHEAHLYADARPWLVVPNAFNVLVNVPLFVAGAWGWHATGAAMWPTRLRASWRGFHALVMLLALAAAAYHAAPSNTLFACAHAILAGVVSMLTCALLAERVDPRFASTATLGCVCAGATAMGLALLWGERAAGAIDMRPVLLMEMLPLLLIPAGVLNLPGAQTRPTDWMVMLSSYGVAKVFELADGPIFPASGWISGHSLMHLSLAVTAGWMAYRASMAPVESDAPLADAASQRSSSLNTTSADAM